MDKYTYNSLSSQVSTLQKRFDFVLKATNTKKEEEKNSDEETLNPIASFSTNEESPQEKTTEKENKNVNSLEYLLNYISNLTKFSSNNGD